MAGRLRNKLTLESRTEAIDAYGDATLSYATLGYEWGSVEAVSAQEQLDSQQIQAAISHRIIIRSNTSSRSLAPDDRITFDSRTFDIVSLVDRDGRRKFLEIMALERL